ncbi:hypothetical protein HDV05_003050, partial [Chytridiales sp. JEL 0842]
MTTKLQKEQILEILDTVGVQLNLQSRSNKGGIYASDIVTDLIDTCVLLLSTSAPYSMLSHSQFKELWIRFKRFALPFLGIAIDDATGTLSTVPWLTEQSELA